MLCRLHSQSEAFWRDAVWGQLDTKTTHLRRVLFQHGLEVLGALAAGVQPCEHVEECFQCRPVVVCGFLASETVSRTHVWEPHGDEMQQAPCPTPEFRPNVRLYPSSHSLCSRVAHLRHDNLPMRVCHGVEPAPGAPSATAHRLVLVSLVVCRLLASTGRDMGVSVALFRR